MGFDDMSDEDKKAMLDSVKSNFGSFGNNQQPSYASQNVPEDVSQPLNDNENNIDAQQDAKQAALDKLIQQGSTLTPMNQKIAEGLGGMGSIRNIAMKEAQPLIKGVAPYVEEAANGIMNKFGKNAVPLAERPSASFMQKAGESAPNFSSRAEQFAHMDNAAKTARFKAMELEKVNPYSTEAKLANQQAFRLEQEFNKYKDMYKN